MDPVEAASEANKHVEDTTESSHLNQKDVNAPPQQPESCNDFGSSAPATLFSSSRFSDLLEDDDAISSKLPQKIPDCVRTKLVQGSGSPRFLVKHSLKASGASFKDKRIPARGVSIRGQIDDGVVGEAQVSADLRHVGISLREWFTQRSRKLNKTGRLFVFKQILELVDTSHSQYLALLHLRPSYIMIFPSNRVKYAGSFVRLSPMELSDGMEHGLKVKRDFERGKEVGQLPPMKHQKLSDRMSLGRLNVKLLDDFGRGSFRGENCGCNPSELQNSPGNPAVPGIDHWQSVSEVSELEERWYSSPGERNDNTLPSSNMYSLGVLLFELLCYSESREMHSAAMSDLGRRILPPNFLSKNPAEAGLCLWMIHPKPFSRPKTREYSDQDQLGVSGRDYNDFAAGLCLDLKEYQLEAEEFCFACVDGRDIINCDVINKDRDICSVDRPLISVDEEDAEAELSLHFLFSLKEQKKKQAIKLVEDIGCLEEDIAEGETRHSSGTEFLPNNGGFPVNLSDMTNRYDKSDFIHQEPLSGLSMSSVNMEKLIRNIDQLENAYFSMRYKANHSEYNSAERSDKDSLKIQKKWNPVQNDTDTQCAEKGFTTCFGAFFEGLCKYARFSKFEVRGCLRNVDILNAANVICSLSFDRDEDYFATAGVSKKIKVFEFGSLLTDSDIHYPVIEMSNKSKLSCVCWNNYIKNYLASTDYDGVVKLWDASTGQRFLQYIEHQKRAWSVDFSLVDPKILASGSDDCSVKLWSISERNCIDTIRNVANVCCVQFSSSGHLLSFGSADYKIYCYDLRNTRTPWCTLDGHGKAVSYVKFLDPYTLVSASTDNSLKLWDLRKTNASGLSAGACCLTMSGHTNEKNFVGLSVCDGYIACGSETNEVFAYYKTLPIPIAYHKFGSIDSITGEETGDDNGQFVSSVCWRRKSSMIISANSNGSIKLLQMV